jgi:ABC-2 type transport system ATP-binding protein
MRRVGDQVPQQAARAAVGGADRDRGPVRPTLLVRTSDPVLDPAWTVRPVSLDDMVLAYMNHPGGAARADLAALEIAS